MISRNGRTHTVAQPGCGCDTCRFCGSCRSSEDSSWPSPFALPHCENKPDNQPHSENPDMDCPTTNAIIGVVGILIGALIGNRFAWDRDDRLRRATFYSRMCGLKSLAGKIENHKFSVWFANCQFEVEKECALVQGAIRWRHHKQFAAARKKCAEPQSESDIADPFNMEIGVVRFGEITYQSGRLRITGLLDELIACAS